MYIQFQEWKLWKNEELEKQKPKQLKKNKRARNLQAAWGKIQKIRFQVKCMPRLKKSHLKKELKRPLWLHEKDKEVIVENLLF